MVKLNKVCGGKHFLKNSKSCKGVVLYTGTKTDQPIVKIHVVSNQKIKLFSKKWNVENKKK